MRKFLLLILLLSQANPVLAATPTLPTFPPLTFQPPKPERVVLDNGLVLFLLEDHELPLIKLSSDFLGGTQYESAEQVGLFSMMGDAWMRGGTLTHSPEQVEQILERKAAAIAFGFSMENGSGQMKSRSEDFDQIFSLYVEFLKQPLFRKDQVELSKNKTLETLRRLNDEPEDVSRREFRKLVYGSAHPYARMATPTTIKKIQRADMLALHKRVVRPNGMMIAISGDFDAVQMKEKVRRALGDWPKGDYVLPTLPAFSTSTVPGVYYIQRPINQSQIRVGTMGLKRHDPDHFAWEIFNELWGGGATSRLFLQVRTQLGLAYSVGSAYSEPADKGLIVAISQTRAPQTIAAVQAILKISGEIRTAPFTPAEVRTAKEAIRNRYVENFTSSAQIANEVMNMEFFGFPADYLTTYPERVAKVELADLKRVAEKYVRAEGNTILIVGDLSTFDKPISTLGKAREVRPPDYSREPE